jgi:hypothetical protein
MMPARTRLGLVALVALVGLGLLFVWRSMPHIPAGAASKVIAVVSPEGDVTPDAAGGSGDDQLPRSPAGQGCLDQLTTPGGSMDLCWQAQREGRDDDPERDFYTFRFYGTFVAGEWAVLRAHVGSPDGARIEEQSPTGKVEGPCGVLAPGGFVGSSGQDARDRCGLLLGGMADGDATRSSAEWTCQDGCGGDAIDRQIELRQLVSVPEGQRPSWELFADAGS